MKVCPSAQPTDDGSVVIGIVGRQDAEPQVSNLSKPVPLQSVAYLIPHFILSHGGAAFCGTLRGNDAALISVMTVARLLPELLPGYRRSEIACGLVLFARPVDGGIRKGLLLATDAPKS